MSRYSGKIGFNYEKETDPGVYEPVIEEYQYYGEYYRMSRRNQQQSESTNDSLKIQNEFSIVCDAFASDHLSKIIYLTFMGERYKVTDIQVSSPRLIINIGEVYHGPVPGEENETS